MWGSGELMKGVKERYVMKSEWEGLDVEVTMHRKRRS